MLCNDFATLSGMHCQYDVSADLTKQGSLLSRYCHECLLSHVVFNVFSSAGFTVAWVAELRMELGNNRAPNAVVVV